MTFNSRYSSVQMLLDEDRVSSAVCEAGAEKSETGVMQLVFCGHVYGQILIGYGDVLGVIILTPVKKTS